ncbi:MAG: hypothetical protein ACYC3K_08820 [Candidatus Nanopelagicales bacterium]
MVSTAYRINGVSRRGTAQVGQGPAVGAIRSDLIVQRSPSPRFDFGFGDAPDGPATGVFRCQRGRPDCPCFRLPVRGARHHAVVISWSVFRRAVGGRGRLDGKTARLGSLVLGAAVVLIAACSSGPDVSGTPQVSIPPTGSAAPPALEPAPQSSGVVPDSQAPPASPAVVLADRFAVRGEKVRVPETWHLFTIDGGGSGSYSIWIDPGDGRQWIAVADGVEAGSWCQLDGVAGSIDPTGMFPANAAIDRLSQGLFQFSYPGSEYSFEAGTVLGPTAPASVKGVWLASPQCDGYASLAYSLPGWEQAVIDGLVRDFVQGNPVS